MPRFKVKAPKRQIALRLANGDSRQRIGVGWPPALVEAADLIAVAKGESRSWALEQIVNRAVTQAVSQVNEKFDLKIKYETPEYTPRKKKEGR